MNILFLSRLYYPHIGGVEKHIKKISNLLIKKGNKITIITEKDNPKEKEIEIKKSLKIYRIPIKNKSKLKKFLIWLWLFKRRKIIHNADIIHAHDVAFWYFPFRIFYPKKPFFITFHGYEVGKLPTIKSIIIRKISEKISLGNICIGKFITKWYKTKPTFILYGAADIPQVKQNKKYKYDACFLGRVDRDTGIMKYLQALKILKDKGQTIDLIICGDGSEVKKAKHFAREASIKVKFLGFVKNPIPYLINSRFAFVSSYLAIIEAAQSKKLIFATYNNEIKKDYLKTMPISSSIIIRKTAKELADQISYFLKNPREEKKLIQKSYLWASKQTWEKITQAYIDLWTINSK